MFSLSPNIRYFFNRSEFTPFDLVRLLLAAVLLTAAGFKSYGLIFNPPVESSVFNARWFLILVVEAELFLAIWLLVGVHAPVLRWTGIIWFVCLLGFGLSQAITGARSCACFGPVDVAPWVVVTFDAVAVVALWLVHPSCGFLPPPKNLLTNRYATHCADAVLCLSDSVRGSHVAEC